METLYADNRIEYYKVISLKCSVKVKYSKHALIWDQDFTEFGANLDLGSKDYFKNLGMLTKAVSNCSVQFSFSSFVAQLVHEVFSELIHCHKLIFALFNFKTYMLFFFVKSNDVNIYMLATDDESYSI